MNLSLFSDSVTLTVQQKSHLDLEYRSSIIGFTPREGEQGSLQKDLARLFSFWPFSLGHGCLSVGLANKGFRQG